MEGVSNKKNLRFELFSRTITVQFNIKLLKRDMADTKTSKIISQPMLKVF